MQASPKATLDCVDAFDNSYLSLGMDTFDVPKLVVYGAGDETVPIDSSGRAAADTIKQSELRE